MHTCMHTCMHTYMQSIRAAKQAHYYDIFNEHRNDIQKTWTSIKNVLNQGKGYDKLTNVFLIDNKICSDKGFDS